MKKTIAIIMTLALAASALAIPALADSGDTSTDIAITAKGGPGGQMRGNGQAPNGQAPDNSRNNGQAQNGQVPDNSRNNGQAPNGQGPNNSRNNGQAPSGQAPDNSRNNGQTPNGQAPDNSRNNGQIPGGQASDNGGSNGQVSGGQAPDSSRMPEEAGKPGGKGMVSFEDMLKNGVIDQDTYDAIQKYMQENKPEDQAPQAKDDQGNPSRGQEGQEMTPPEGAPEMNADAGEDPMLKVLLEQGVITREQYDAIAAAMAADVTADTAAAADETAST